MKYKNGYQNQAHLSTNFSDNPRIYIYIYIYIYIFFFFWGGGSGWGGVRMDVNEELKFF